MISMSPEKILENVKTLKSEYDILKKSERNEDTIKRQLMEKYPDFSGQYPALFHLVFNPIDNWNEDLKRLTQMVELASRTKKNEISQHDASVEIGTKLEDKYVKPKLSKKS